MDTWWYFSCVLLLGIALLIYWYFPFIFFQVSRDLSTLEHPCIINILNSAMTESQEIVVEKSSPGQCSVDVFQWPVNHSTPVCLKNVYYFRTVDAVFKNKMCSVITVCSNFIQYSTGGKHKARRPNPALHLVLSGPAPCFYPAAAPSSLPLVKE